MHLSKVAYLLKDGRGMIPYSNSIAVMALLTAFPSGENADFSNNRPLGPFNGWSHCQLAQEWARASDVEPWRWKRQGRLGILP